MNTGNTSVKLRHPAARLAKWLLIAAAVAALGLIAGCASEFAAPFDIANLYFKYSLVSGSDGEYIVITEHIVSQSNVKIPDTIYGIPVREVGESVFADDAQIQSVSFGKHMRKLGNNAFGGCTALTSVDFNVSMTDIGAYAFQGCTALKELALPDNLASLGRGAFYDCKSLADIAIPEGVSHIGGRAFYNTAWLRAQSGTSFVVAGNGILVACNVDKERVTLPKNIRQIAGAFAGNTTVQRVTLNAKLESIGDMAFMGCTALTSVTIPGSVTEIGDSAFYGCASLQQLTLGGNLQTIGEEAFAHCGAALYVSQGSAAEAYCQENGLHYTVR